MDNFSVPDTTDVYVVKIKIVQDYRQSVARSSVGEVRTDFTVIGTFSFPIPICSKHLAAVLTIVDHLTSRHQVSGNSIW